MGGCRGSGLKVIATLLPHLPTDLNYRVIFMRRRLAEMVASQNRMLVNQGRPASDLAGPRVAQALGRHENQMLAWARGQAHMRILPLVFHEILAAPEEAAYQVRQFLRWIWTKRPWPGSWSPASIANGRESERPLSSSPDHGAMPPCRSPGGLPLAGFPACVFLDQKGLIPLFC